MTRIRKCPTPEELLRVVLTAHSAPREGGSVATILYFDNTTFVGVWKAEKRKRRPGNRDEVDLGDEDTDVDELKLRFQMLAHHPPRPLITKLGSRRIDWKWHHKQ